MPARAGSLYGKMKFASDDNPARRAQEKDWTRYPAAYGPLFRRPEHCVVRLP